ncbi:MAG: alpha/beta fold hydrolase [Gammaproteobacteria bacterium]|nr:alpha/beta fold hydrolase [Gammaproteobacteria bacterium]
MKSLKDKQEWQEHTLELGDFALSSGATLRSARLHYHQLGAPDAPKSNLVLLPTYFGGTGAGNRPWVDHPGSPLQDASFCVIIPCLLGAGESSSPSNTVGEQGGAGFPQVSLVDNVRAQRALLQSRFGDAAPRLVAGWSMGGMQALQWTQLYPDRARAVLAVCATGRCYPHNAVFLEGVASALQADAAYAQGRYQSPPRRGLAAFATVYAGWAYSQAFFRDGLYRELGFESSAALLDYWVQDHLLQDANNLLTQLATWKSGDVFAGLPHPRKPMRGRVCLMPCSTDLYFTAEDAARDASLLGAQLQLLDSPFGHIAGGPGRLARETAEVFRVMSSLLSPVQT